MQNANETFPIFIHHNDHASYSVMASAISQAGNEVLFDMRAVPFELHEKIYGLTATIVLLTRDEMRQIKSAQHAMRSVGPVALKNIFRNF